MDEPYYNEAGYERQKGTQQGLENSRMYNETVLLKLTQSMNKIAKDPPPTFAQEVAGLATMSGNTILFHSSQQLPCVRLVCYFRKYRDTVRCVALCAEVPGH